MPHITLLYPFHERDLFNETAGHFRAALSATGPFEVTLATFRSFEHTRGRYTLWLAPEPVVTLRRLQEDLQRAAPGCDDVQRFSGGYTPHLSIGQVEGRARLEALRNALQINWQPLTFRAEHISLIHRSDPPDDIFRVVEDVRLTNS
jgi:2'-5' RNA ligase